MHLSIHIGLVDSKIRHWLADLIATLQQQGHSVALQSSSQGPDAFELQLLTGFDQAIYRSKMTSPFLLQPLAQFADMLNRPDAPQPDLVVDLMGDAPASSSALLCVQCNGQVGEGALWQAVLACTRSPQHLPHLAIVYRDAGSEFERTVLTALPALEEPHQFTASLARLCQRVIDLICQSIRLIEDQPIALSHGHHSSSAKPQFVSPSQTLSRNLLSYMGASLIGGAVRRLTRPFGRSDHWRIAWRRLDSAPLSQAFATKPESLFFLPDNGQHFYADPFILWREGKAHVFCEDLPYATGRGVIAHFTIDATGQASAPQSVLQRPYHLSYPFLFDHEGVTYMIPETAQNKTIELYRCDHFPDQWSFVRVLIDQVEAADATLLWHEGRWWIFASLAGEGRSSWDALGLFYADQLEGPWHAHRANPVMIDAAQARPAGAIVQQQGALIRPAQDCRGGYGRGVQLCRIDRLDLQAYQQTVIDTLQPSGHWGYSGLHTLNRAGPWEIFDLKGWRSQMSMF